MGYPTDDQFEEARRHRAPPGDKKVVVTPSPRPETQEAEDAYLLGAYREALTEISNILKLPGSPSLTTDVVAAARRMAEGNDRAREKSRTGVLKSIAPGAIVNMSIDAGDARYLSPKRISVACFAAADAELVYAPLVRLPVLLKAASIQGVNQNLGELGVFGIPDEETEPETDPAPATPESTEYIFRHIAPVPVDWAVLGWRSHGLDLGLMFKNICERMVHVFVRVDGEPYSSASGY